MCIVAAAIILATVSSCEPWCSKWTCNQPSFCGSCAPCAPHPPPPPMAPIRFANRNPFASPHGWYVNPVLRAKILQTTMPLAESESERTALRHMASTPSAFWVDRKAKIRGTTVDTMEGLLLNNSRGAQQLVVFILYNLPNRDCNAKASDGEICCDGRGGGVACDRSSGSCEAGLREYREDYIRPVARVLERFHSTMPIVLILEPDSLGNVVTNAGSEGCTEATLRAYREGIRFAAETLASTAPSVALYVDAGHGGWLGWIRLPPGLDLSDPIMSSVASLSTKDRCSVSLFPAAAARASCLEAATAQDLIRLVRAMMRSAAVHTSRGRLKRAIGLPSRHGPWHAMPTCTWTRWEPWTLSLERQTSR